ncbi:hypothetical protein QOT17_003739 [Balamuthia mandrillaris]
MEEGAQPQQQNQAAQDVGFNYRHLPYKTLVQELDDPQWGGRSPPVPVLLCLTCCVFSALSTAQSSTSSTSMLALLLDETLPLLLDGTLPLLDEVLPLLFDETIPLLLAEVLPLLDEMLLEHCPPLGRDAAPPRRDADKMLPHLLDGTLFL